jgi:hypothetical protein
VLTFKTLWQYENSNDTLSNVVWDSNGQIYGSNLAGVVIVDSNGLIDWSRIKNAPDPTTENSGLAAAAAALGAGGLILGGLSLFGAGGQLGEGLLDDLNEAGGNDYGQDPELPAGGDSNVYIAWGNLTNRPIASSDLDVGLAGDILVSSCNSLYACTCNAFSLDWKNSLLISDTVIPGVGRNPAQPPFQVYDFGELTLRTSNISAYGGVLLAGYDTTITSPLTVDGYTSFANNVGCTCNISTLSLTSTSNAVLSNLTVTGVASLGATNLSGDLFAPFNAVTALTGTFCNLSASSIDFACNVAVYCSNVVPLGAQALIAAYNAADIAIFGCNAAVFASNQAPLSSASAVFASNAAYFSSNSSVFSSNTSVYASNNVPITYQALSNAATATAIAQFGSNTAVWASNQGPTSSSAAIFASNTSVYASNTLVTSGGASVGWAGNGTSNIVSHSNVAVTGIIQCSNSSFGLTTPCLTLYSGDSTTSYYGLAVEGNTHVSVVPSSNSYWRWQTCTGGVNSNVMQLDGNANLTVGYGYLSSSCNKGTLTFAGSTLSYSAPGGFSTPAYRWTGYQDYGSNGLFLTAGPYGPSNHSAPSGEPASDFAVKWWNGLFLNGYLTANWEFSCSSDACFKLGGGSWYNPSSSKLKDQIEEADDGLLEQTMLDVPLKRWRWIDGVYAHHAGFGVVDRHQIGFVTDDVRPHFGHSIKTMRHPGLPGEDAEALDASQLHMVCYGVTRSLLKRVKALEEKVAGLIK